MGAQLLHWFTTADNQTGDLGRVLWCFCVVAYVALSFVAIFKGQVFSALEWSSGASAILLGGGGALALKKGTEPGVK